MLIISIACVDADNGIGKNQCIPWKNKDDMQLFKTLTINNVVIMGHNTYKSMGSKPLHDRINIVVSSSTQSDCSAIDNNRSTVLKFVTSVHDALEYAKLFNNKIIFVIGGQSIYEQIDADITILTRLDRSYDCDKFFPIDKKNTRIDLTYKSLNLEVLFA